MCADRVGLVWRGNRRGQTWDIRCVVGVIGSSGRVPPTAVADAPTPTTAPLVRSLTYNIRGNSTVSGCTSPRAVDPRRAEVVAQTQESKADLVLVQEMCRQQDNAINQSLKAVGYSSGHFETFVERPGGSVHDG